MEIIFVFHLKTTVSEWEKKRVKIQDLIVVKIQMKTNNNKMISMQADREYKTKKKYGLLESANIFVFHFPYEWSK